MEIQARLKTHPTGPPEDSEQDELVLAHTEYALSACAHVREQHLQLLLLQAEALELLLRG
mgnify:CR=1 FL=1